MRQRQSVKQYINYVETANDLVKNQRPILRQIHDISHCNVLYQVKMMFYTLHPTAHLKDLFQVRDSLVPTYRALSDVNKDNEYIEVSAFVSADGIATFSYGIHKKR